MPVGSPLRPLLQLILIDGNPLLLGGRERPHHECRMVAGNATLLRDPLSPLSLNKWHTPLDHTTNYSCITPFGGSQFSACHNDNYTKKGTKSEAIFSPPLFLFSFGSHSD